VNDKLDSAEASDCPATRRSSLRASPRAIGFALMICVLAAALLAASYVAAARERALAAKPRPDRITIALSRNPVAALIRIAAERGFFAAAGLEVAIEDASEDRAALDAVARGRARVASASDGPFVLAVLGGAPVAAIAAIASAQDGAASPVAGAGPLPPTFLLVVEKDFGEQQADVLRRMLGALLEAEAFVKQRPVEAAALVARRYGSDAVPPAEFFGGEESRIRLDRSLPSILEAKTQWAVRRGLAAANPVPNYLEHLNRYPLLAANPAAVSVVR
jgi:ABC-type nitrate/sulfonate/bicarbonate transport system substrate-binding protein